MKRHVALFLVVCLVAVTLSGLAEIVYPIETEQPVTLKVWMRMDAGTSQVYTNYSESPVYQKFQEVTGVNLEFVHPTYGSVKEGFALMMSGDTLPDLIVNFSEYYRGGWSVAYDDGVIWDLTPYLQTYAPDYYALINRDDATRREYYDEYGRVMAFARVSAAPNPTSHSIIMRSDWLEEFGMNPEEIDTYAEAEAYFKAVQDSKPGVVPLMLGMDMKPFYYGYNLVPVVSAAQGTGFLNVDGAITHSSVSQEYKDWLTLMNSWYEKGYISVDFAATTNAQTRKMFSAGTVACICTAIGNAYSDAQASGVAMVKTPYWTQAEGQQVHVTAFDADPCDIVATTSCDEKYLPVICQMLNFAYTQEGSRFANWGPEGISWNWGEKGETVWTDWVINNPNYGTSVTHNLCRMNYWPRLAQPDAVCNPNVLKDETVLALRTQYTDMEGWDDAYILPLGVTLTVDELDERARIMTNCDTYFQEMRMKFITGETSLDKWDEYVAQLKGFGIDTAIKLTQTAYDRYLTR